jgi:hypothetical protein
LCLSSGIGKVKCRRSAEGCQHVLLIISSSWTSHRTYHVPAGKIVSCAEKKNINSKYLIMKMLGILFDQVDNFAKYIMIYITWYYYGNEG